MWLSHLSGRGVQRMYTAVYSRTPCSPVENQFPRTRTRLLLSFNYFKKKYIHTHVYKCKLYRVVVYISYKSKTVYVGMSLSAPSSQRMIIIIMII